MPTRAWRRGVLAVAGLIAGCNPFSTLDDPEPPVALPAEWSAGGEAERAAEPGASAGGASAAWWERFEDPALTALVERALAGNPSVRAAETRIAQARALETQAGARRWPWLDARVSGSWQRQILTIPTDLFMPPGGGMGGMGPSGGQTQTFDVEQYRAVLEGSWQPDVFGGVDAEAAAAGLDLAALEQGAATTELRLAARVAQTWYRLVGARAQRAALGELVELTIAYFELTAFRFERGLADALALLQQREQVAATRARLVAAQAAAESLEQQLVVLLGEPPRRVELPPADSFPSPPPLPALGVPAEVVAQRPDVRAAQLRVEAADERIGSAIAARLPSLQLTGTVGFGAQEPADVFEHVIWSGMVAVTQPIFHGRALGARVDQNRALLEERLADYADVVLQAMLEVEQALAGARYARERLAVLEERAQVAQEALEQARLRWTQGLVGFVSVLQSQNAYIDARVSLVDARQALFERRVALHGALAGDWTAGGSADGRGGNPPASAAPAAAAGGGSAPGGAGPTRPGGAGEAGPGRGGDR